MVFLNIELGLMNIHNNDLLTARLRFSVNDFLTDHKMFVKLLNTQLKHISIHFIYKICTNMFLIKLTDSQINLVLNKKS